MASALHARSARGSAAGRDLGRRIWARPPFKLMGADQPRHRRDFNREAREQAAIISYIRTVAPALIAFHVPNGGWRTPAEAARFRWLGVLSGVPDICIVGRDGVVRFIEVKSETGSLSLAQREMRDRLLAMRCPYVVARNVDDVRVAFKAWGIETREAKP
jgi:hypothetical protein